MEELEQNTFAAKISNQIVPVSPQSLQFEPQNCFQFEPPKLSPNCFQVKAKNLIQN